MILYKETDLKGFLFVRTKALTVETIIKYFRLFVYKVLRCSQT